MLPRVNEPASPTTPMSPKMKRVRLPKEPVSPYSPATPKSKDAQLHLPNQRTSTAAASSAKMRQLPNSSQAASALPETFSRLASTGLRNSRKHALRFPGSPPPLQTSLSADAVAPEPRPQLAVTRFIRSDPAGTNQLLETRDTRYEARNRVYIQNLCFPQVDWCPQLPVASSSAHQPINPGRRQL